jgi:hypothetical protein
MATLADKLITKYSVWDNMYLCNKYEEVSGLDLSVHRIPTDYTFTIDGMGAMDCISIESPGTKFKYEYEIAPMDWVFLRRDAVGCQLVVRGVLPIPDTEKRFDQFGDDADEDVSTFLCPSIMFVRQLALIHDDRQNGETLDETYKFALENNYLPPLPIWLDEEDAVEILQPICKNREVSGLMARIVTEITTIRAEVTNVGEVQSLCVTHILSDLYSKHSKLEDQYDALERKYTELEGRHQSLEAKLERLLTAMSNIASDV